MQEKLPRSAEIAANAAFILLLAGGGAAVTVGAALLHPAAGWIVGGVLSIVAALKVLP